VEDVWKPVDRIGKLLPKVLARQPASGRVIEMRARLAFAEILGAALAADCEALELRGSTLTVITPNPALAHQLRLDAEGLLERLNASSPGRRIRTLKVRTGRRNPSA
jgi:predicted nucleic acid-binding Zn ribbon protein